MDKCSVTSLKNIDKIKSIKSEYVIISDKKYDVDDIFEKANQFPHKY